MENIQKQAAALVAQMTTEEKASLCSGHDFWHTKGIPRLGIPSICLTDGPHGLRKQAEGAAELSALEKSVPTTCFPTACVTACSFDEALLEEMGRAMAEECLAEEVAVILGPGANAKRSPLCGRSFEYFSEDPLVSGKCAAALIRGVESRGVGTSLKHFAANSQEDMRMVSNSIVDPRALRETYLTAFEIAVKEGKPATVMCSYNLINGTYGCEHTPLLGEILRDAWGFSGLVMTDWGAMNQRVPALLAGLDLEMPGPAPARDAEIVAAASSGALPMEALDAAAARVVALALRAKENKAAAYDKKAHHTLARKIACAGAVLLENDGTLPLTKQEKIALIGGFAKEPRYQGAGSSQIIPTSITDAVTAFEAMEANFVYAEGFATEQEAPNVAKEKAALEAAAACDVVVVCAGLPASYESEGFDRTHLNLPVCQTQLIEALHNTGKPVVVVVHCGGSVVLPFAQQVNALLLMGLAGQATGGAAADLLFGVENPCGKLAETYPLTDCAAGNRPWFGGRQVQYRESIYMGYRWFDKANLAVQYPFGHGLSYTAFAYKNLRLSAAALQDTETVTLTVTVENIGSRAGSEIVQVYVSAPQTTLPRPVRELRGFAKVHLQQGEAKDVAIILDKRAFAYYNAPAACWHTESGSYTVAVGGSSRDLPLSATVELAGDRSIPVPDMRQSAPAYFDPENYMEGEAFMPPQRQFEALLGHSIPLPPPQLPYTPNSAFIDLQQTRLGRFVFRVVEKKVRKAFLGGAGVGGASAASSTNLQRMMESMMYGMPLRGLCMVTNGAVSPRMVDGFVDMLNGSVWKGLGKLFSRKPK